MPIFMGCSIINETGYVILPPFGKWGMKSKIVSIFVAVSLIYLYGYARDIDLNASLKPLGGAITSSGTAEPVTVSLSQMVQAPPTLDPDEELHEEEGELIHKENWTYKTPHFSPKHFFQQDESIEDELQRSPGLVQGPILKSGFLGIPNQGPPQPDCNIAVGPTRIMLAVNDQVAVYTKTGERRFMTSFERWFSALSMAAESTLFDPKLVYDQQAGHFLFLCNARRHDKRSWFLLSISKTSDPEGEWVFYALDMQLTGGVREIFWADFPRMALDQNAIYLTANMTEFGSLGFRYAKIRVLRKSQVYQFRNITWREFARLTDSHGYKAINIEPVLAFGASASGYLVSTTPFDGFKLTLWTIANPGTTNPKISKKGIVVSSYQFPPSAVQKGGNARLNTRDAGLYNAVFHNGSIYTAHNAAYDWGSGPVSAIRFYQIKTNGELVQEITYGKNGYFYFYPVVMVDGRDNVVLGFNRCSASTFAGIFFTGRKAADPLGKFQNLGRLVPGRTYYSIVFRGSEIGRWGDYNGIALDADDSIYIYSEFVKTSTEWDSFVGQVQF
jgi:hypothetical protein